MKRCRLFSMSRLPAVAAIAIPCVAVTAFYGAPGAGATSSKAGVSISGTTRQIQGVSTTTQSSSTSTASAAQAPELFQAASGGDGGAVVADRSNSKASGAPAVGAVTQPKPVTTSTPGLVASFQGLNHFLNRFGNSGSPNTFSLEPPDQGLCVGSDGNGNTRVVEALNDVLGVYTTGGQLTTAKPQDLNSFFGYAPSIIRMPNPDDDPLGPFVTDPSCYYDASAGRWYVDVLTLDVFPRFGEDGLEHFTGTNHLDLAVSQTSDPSGAWTIYRVPVQDDGTDGTPNHGCAINTVTAAPVPTNPTGCIGDYPHLGVDANGVYLTTNEYSLFGIDFHGAQVYAFSKSQLVSGSPTVSVTQIDTHGADTFGFAQHGFTLWPSTTPGGGGDPASGGTEWFLSSNAAAEAHDPGDGSSTSHPSTQLLTWALTNTSSLNGSPALSLSNTVLNVGRYAQPPSSNQKSGNTPLRDCLNNNSCSTNAVLGIKDPFPEQPYNLDSNDTRMQQVTWVNGKLWGALDTALQTTSGSHAGIEWFDVAPSAATGSASAALVNQGYVGIGNDNLTYPAIGVTASGTGVMGFTVVGTDYYPSAGYATVTDAGVSAVHVAGAGVGPADGFSGYKIFGNTPGIARPRWGDYGAAVPVDGNVWIASEYIAQSCSLATFERTSFRCGNTRTQLANWSTRISEVAAP